MLLTQVSVRCERLAINNLLCSYVVLSWLFIDLWFSLMSLSFIWLWSYLTELRKRTNGRRRIGTCSRCCWSFGSFGNLIIVTGYRIIGLIIGLWEFCTELWFLLLFLLWFRDSTTEHLVQSRRNLGEVLFYTCFWDTVSFCLTCNNCSQPHAFIPNPVFSSILFYVIPP